MDSSAQRSWLLLVVDLGETKDQRVQQRLHPLVGLKRVLHGLLRRVHGASMSRDEVGKDVLDLGQNQKTSWIALALVAQAQ